MTHKIVALVCAAMLSVSAFSQVQQIVGNWKTVDDKTGENYSIIHIFKATDGLYYGKIAKMLVGPADLVCEACEGHDHNKPLEGLLIIRGMHEENGELRGGKVLDPESGKFYYGKIFLKDGKLVLRGSIDKRGILGRSQTWLRAQ
ncbi:MAG: DUF2147 domain-containing protein [Paludibacteraceae bacterium]|nr:DUF2147 domain-containing protein [Bacteroidales bacterium]MDY4148986.1 DUF2147 domain-containing protein [Paludibacteraceae bacterium]